MAQITLTRQYTYLGTVYGPGSEEVPDAAAEALRQREAEYAAYLAQGGEPMPPATHAGVEGGAHWDARLRKPKPESVTRPGPATPAIPNPPPVKQTGPPPVKAEPPTPPPPSPVWPEPPTKQEASTREEAPAKAETPAKEEIQTKDLFKPSPALINAAEQLKAKERR